MCLTHTLTRLACPGHAWPCERAVLVKQDAVLVKQDLGAMSCRLNWVGPAMGLLILTSRRTGPLPCTGSHHGPVQGPEHLATPLISLAWRFRASGRHLHHANRYTTDGVADFDRPRPRRQDVMPTGGCQHHWQAGSRTGYLHDRSGAFCGRPRSRCVTRRRMHATSPPPADLSAGRVVCQATTDGEFTDDPG